MDARTGISGLQLVSSYWALLSGNAVVSAPGSATLHMIETDVLILGAGAAGLFCAIHAGRRGRRVLVLDHADRPGKKILISGGGRCNFTNLKAGPENFLSANPHFAKSALARYTPQDFLRFVEQHRIPWHEKTLGQLFCDRSAHDILNMLLAECTAANARVQLATRVMSVSENPQHAKADPAAANVLSFRSAAKESASRFLVETSQGPIRTQSLVIATGGLSIPKLGATSLGYDLARQFGHPIVEPRPALVPLVLSPEDQARWCDLTGLSTEVIASTTPATRSKSQPPAFREKMLITHRGLSGPAILQISSYWRPGEVIELNLAPGQGSVFDPLTQARARRDLAAAAIVLRSILPTRMATRWLELHQPANLPGPQAPLSNATLAELDCALHAWRIIPAGTEGFAKAEVTAGGVSTDALDARTMESRLVPGLYFIGEVVDVTGWLGGYNFQWAWASAAACGRSF